MYQFLPSNLERARSVFIFTVVLNHVFEQEALFSGLIFVIDYFKKLSSLYLLLKQVLLLWPCFSTLSQHEVQVTVICLDAKQFIHQL